MAKLDMRTAPDVIAAFLRKAILSGELPAGTQLRQDHLAEAQQVSHIPVREALRRLESEGLVTYFARRGAFVSHISAKDAIEITEMRIALECLALRLAIPQATEEDRAAAQAANRRAISTTELSEWSALNWEFHRALYRPCQRPRLINSIETLWRNVDRYIRIIWQISDYEHRPHREHQKILESYRPDMIDECVKLLTQHITDANTILVKSLNENGFVFENDAK